VCRLLGYVSPQPLPMRAAVGADTFDAFRALSCVHGDGWGMAWAGPGEPVRAQRSVAPAADDPEFTAAASEVPARAGFLHLRWATTGIAVTPANTHPFVGDGWALAHNGFVRNSGAIERALSPARRSALRGTTDSERYFALVLQEADRAGDIVAGLRAAAALIAELSGSVSVNAMLLSDERLLAVQGLAGAQAPLEDMLAKVTSPDLLPLDHLEGYFALRYRWVDRALVVASSGLPRSGWHDQPADSVLDVDVTTGDCRFHPLLGRLAA
jgi:predicted glutamine amidotransferase